MLTLSFRLSAPGHSLILPRTLSSADAPGPQASMALRIYLNLYQGSLLFHINHICGYKGIVTCCIENRIATTIAPIMVLGCNYVSTPTINCRLKRG